VLGLAGVWQGIGRLDEPKHGLWVSLVIVAVFMTAAVLAAQMLGKSGTGGSTYSFYLRDEAGNYIKATPKNAFGLFSLWTGESNLGSTFSICYDCRVKVKDSPSMPANLWFEYNTFVMRDDTRQWWASGGAGWSQWSSIENRKPFRSYSASTGTVATYTAGWVSDGGGSWHADYGKSPYNKLTTVTIGVNEVGIWDVDALIGVTLKFTEEIRANVFAGGASVQSGWIASPMFAVVKKNPLSATVWFEDVTWEIRGGG